jgi:hypothetical protein
MSRGFTQVTFLVMGTLLVWLACFTAIYVLGAVACARDFAQLRIAGLGIPGVVSTLLVLAAAAFTAWRVQCALRQRQRGDQNAKFTQFLALSLGTLVLVGLGLLTLPALLVRPACAGQPALGLHFHTGIQADQAAGFP